ncbi:MAG: PDZ domain-containing protein [Alphaproteobacteria bacterium]
MCRLGLICVLTAVVLASPVRGEEAALVNRPGIYTVPSRMCGPFFLVPLTLPGKAGGKSRELTFLFDSGASITSVDPDAVARISGRTVKAGDRVSLKDARAGPLTFKRLTASAREMDHLARALGEPFDGILGFTAFRNFLLTADYPNQRLQISRGTLPPADGREVFEARGPDRRPWLKIRAGKRTHEVLIDTGSSSTFALRAHENMRWRSRPLPVRVFAHTGTLEQRKAGRMDGEIGFGRHRIKNPLVYLTPDETELMGGGILRHFAVTFDQRYQRVRLRRSRRSDIEMSPLNDTGALLRPRPAGLQVVTVLEGSPAEKAGLRAGDLIVSADGRNIFTRGCPPAGGYREGSQVTYEVKRGRETVAITVPRGVLVE